MLIGVSVDPYWMRKAKTLPAQRTTALQFYVSEPEAEAALRRGEILLDQTSAAVEAKLHTDLFFSPQPLVNPVLNEAKNEIRVNKGHPVGVHLTVGQEVMYKNDVWLVVDITQFGKSPFVTLVAPDYSEFIPAVGLEHLEPVKKKRKPKPPSSTAPTQIRKADDGDTEP